MSWCIAFWILAVIYVHSRYALHTSRESARLASYHDRDQYLELGAELDDWQKVAQTLFALELVGADRQSMCADDLESIQRYLGLAQAPRAGGE